MVKSHLLFWQNVATQEIVWAAFQQGSLKEKQV